MSKQKKTIQGGDNVNILIDEQPITDALELNYMPYAMSVILSRAIPEIDGFKPSHRKLLYTMYKMGLITGDRTKSSNVVGQTMKLNPHGDAAIYETMVRLTEGNGALLLPFVDSKGNFGKQYSRDMAYAAPRYTEVKLSSICNEIFEAIDANPVDFVNNYDGSMKEPVLLPTKFPNILVNPNQGIAVGMASSFCGFNLREVCAATINFINNESCDIIKYMPAPDFSTGGEIIYNEESMRKIYETGRGSFKVRAKYTFDKKNSCIEINEIPYTTNIEAIIDKVIQLVKTNKIKEITDIRDETDLGGLKIAIDIKKNSNVETLMHKLFSLTPLCDSFSCNFNMLIDGRPCTLGVKSIMDEWVKFRVDSIKRQISFDINKKSEKRHLLEGLSKILLDIDKAIDIIKNTEKESDVIKNLMAGFEIDKTQSEYIADMKLRNINKEYILNRIKELDNIINEINELKATLESDKKVKNIICNQLKAIAKKYGSDRKTDIIPEDDIQEIDEQDLIDDYGIKLFMTSQNYFKKISLVSMRSSGEQKLKDDDEICIEEESSNRAEILFFSNKCAVYKMKASAINDCKASSFGDFLPNILGMDDDESILYFTSTIDYEGHVLFVFENGKAVKIPLKSYATKVNRKKLINAYSSKSNAVFIKKITDDDDFVMVRNSDKAALINTSLVPVMTSKTSSGVQAFKLKKNSSVSVVLEKNSFPSENIEYYRATSLPTTGHFIQERDKLVKA